MLKGLMVLIGALLVVGCCRHNDRILTEFEDGIIRVYLPDDYMNTEIVGVQIDKRVE